MAADKDTIYVDVDDEITTIIDKVRASDGKVIALVLPKRASVFQSIVNMKLLKRATDSAKKHLVLITTEANLMPLAGAVGLHVAATPQSKPEIPAAAKTAPDDTLDEPIDESEFTADNAGDQPVGELAKRSGHVAAGAEAAVELDDMDDDSEDVPVKQKKNRRLKVPNFNAFRLRLALGILALIALIAGFYVANIVLPRAVIAITTNSSTVNVNLSPTLDTKATTLDAKKLVIPATSEQQQKTYSQQVNATGELNKGDTATGTVTVFIPCSDVSGPPPVIPAGTGLSTNGLTFITQDSMTLSHPDFSDGCHFKDNSAISAQNGGSKYNVTNATFTVANQPSYVTGSGSANGGTDDVVKVVSQADIDGAKQQLSKQDTTDIQTALVAALHTDGVYPLTVTFNASKPKITTDKNVGDQADNVTVTEAITYTMLGVSQSDLDALIKANVSTQIDTTNQTIVNDGLDQATITVGSTSGSTTQLSIQTAATVGPELNVAKIKQDAAGKQIGDVKSQINQIPGVTSVDVQLSPFWVSTIPSNPHQVVVTIDKGK